MKEKVKRTFSRNWRLYVLMLPALLWLIVFAYMPMYGILIAFKDYKGKMGIMGSPWAEPILKHFTSFFSTSVAPQIIGNTIILSLLTILISFPVPVIFALLLNQIKNNRRRKVVQTISYAPYFVSNVVVVSILSVICAPSGFINTIIKFFNGGNALYLTSAAEYFRSLYVISNIWQTVGFSAIVYIAALTGISQDYYEAAQIDGATRLQRIFYITLPCIKSTIVVVLIMTMGNLFGGGLSGSNFEQCYLLGNNVNADTSTIIQTYVFDVGLAQGRYAYATAVGLIQSVISLVLIFASNFVSKKLAGSGLF